MIQQGHIDAEDFKGVSILIVYDHYKWPGYDTRADLNRIPSSTSPDRRLSVPVPPKPRPVTTR